MNNGENNPYNCFIFYMAMKKLKVVIGLWKNAVWHPERAKMLSFLDHDFTEPRWQKAALKNAFALLSKRRFGRVFNIMKYYIHIYIFSFSFYLL